LILFKADWKKYPLAIAHVNTKNKSAKKLARLLKLAGVENYYFFLALHNPALKDIDVFDEDHLTKEQKIAIAIECEENPWYIFRECVRVPPMAGPLPEEFRLNIANIALYWNFFLGFTLFLIQPRQTGKSFSIYILLFAYMSFLSEHSKIGFITKSNENRLEAIDKLKNIFSYVPSYLNFRTKLDSDNKLGLNIGFTSNELKTAVGQSAPTNAMDVGRGLSLPFSVFDEACYTDNIEIIISTAINGMRAAIEAARRNGQFAGVIYSSTVGMKSDRDGAYMYSIYKNGPKFTYSHFDAKDRDELEKIYEQASKDPSVIVIIDVNHRQLGYTDAEWRDTINFGRNSRQMAEIDMLNIWSDGSSRSPLTKEEQDILTSSISDPKHIEISEDGFTLLWFVDEQRMNSYMREDVLFTLDTSDGAGGDFLALTVMDTQTGEVIAAGEYNRINTAKFALWLGEKLVAFKHGVLIIEKRLNAVTMTENIVSVLQANRLNVFEKMFNWLVDDYDINPEAFDNVSYNFKFGDPDYFISHKEKIGFATSGGNSKQSRVRLYGSDNLGKAIKYIGKSVNYNGLSDALLSLIDKDGRIDHPDKKNDDICVSWLLGYWFLSKAKNKHKYVFKNKRFLTDVAEIGRDEEGARIFNSIIDGIKTLKDMLSSTNSEFANRRIMEGIEKLKSHLPRNAVTDINVKEFLDTIGENNLNFNQADTKVQSMFLHGFG